MEMHVGKKGAGNPASTMKLSAASLMKLDKDKSLIPIGSI